MQAKYINSKGQEVPIETMADTYLFNAIKKKDREWEARSQAGESLEKVMETEQILIALWTEMRKRADRAHIAALEEEAYRNVIEV